MHRIGAGFFCDTNDVLDIKIGCNWFFSFANQIAFIRLKTMQRKTIFGGINGDCSDAQFGRCTHDADGDFRAIGNEDFVNFFHKEFVFSEVKSMMRERTSYLNPWPQQLRRED